KTAPVGAPLTPEAPGTLTISGLPPGWGTPWPLYSVLVPVPLLATHMGPPGPIARPQGLIRLGSVVIARPGTSETRLVCTRFADGTQRSSRASSSRVTG